LKEDEFILQNNYIYEIIIHNIIFMKYNFI